MANVDNLNFKVIIDDKQFNKKIKAMEDMAKKFNTSMSNLLNVQAVSQQLVVSNRKRLQMETDLVRATEMQNREKIKTEGLQRKINAQIERASKGYQSQSRILHELKGYALGYLSIHGASQLLSSLVRVTGEFELQKTTLAAMLGDLNAAEGVITRIQGLAVESPFQFKELTTYAKQLSAFSVPAQELYDTTKMLADISAGLGVGMDRIVLAYGQVRSAAFLRGQEVRQFTEAGIPILDELAKQFSELEGRAVSTGEVFDKISARLVPFEMVAKVFKDMTSEGGKFYNMQEVQAETLRGKISNLKDAYEVMLNEIGKGQSEKLKGAVDWARRLMQNYEETGRTLVELVAAYGIYKTMLGVITLFTGTFSIANHKLLLALKGIGTWVVNNPYALIAAGLATIGYTIYKDITALESYEKIQKSIADTQSDFNKAVVTETSKLDTLYAKLNLAKEGTEAYNEAKKEIYTKYASYISELQNEGIAVDNLATIYENLKTKVEESQKARFRSIASQGVEQVYETETARILEEAENATNRLLKETAIEFNATERLAIQAYVGGGITKDELGNDEHLKKVATVLDEAARSGNDAWEQFGTSIEAARSQFEASTKAYNDGLKAIDAVYGKAQDATAGGLNPFTYGLSEGGGKGKSPAQKDIEEQIKSVQKLQDAYEKLLPYLNEVQMKTTLKSLFPNIEAGVIDSLDFDAELTRLADKLEEFDKDAAQRLRDTIGKDVAGSIVESFRAVEQYKKMLDSWLGEDFNLSGEGINFDISKIISNLNTEYAKIDQKRAKALDVLNKAQMGDELALAKVREVLGEDVWQKYLENGEKVINELAQKEREAARVTASEKVRDLAKKYVSEAYFTGGIKLTDLGDKNILQLVELKRRLQEFNNDKSLDIPAEVAEKLAELGITTEKFGQIVNQVIGTDLKDLNEELKKEFMELGKLAVSQIGNIISALGELAQASGDKELESTIKLLQDSADVISSAMQGFATGGWIGAIVGGVGALAEKLINVATEAARVREEMREMQLEFGQAMREFERMQYLNSFSNIFGEADFSRYLAQLKVANDSLSNISAKMRELKSNERRIELLRPTGTELRVAADFDPLTAPTTNLTFDNRTDWQKFWGTGQKNVNEFDLNTLFDENGKPIEAKFEELKIMYEQMGDSLTAEDKETVDALLENWQNYTDAQEENVAFLNNLFGDLASSIADNMINSFIETGDAAAGLEDVFDDLGKNIAKSLLKDFLLTNILNKYKNNIQKLFDESGGFSDEGFWSDFEKEISAMQAEMRAVTPGINKILSNLGFGSEDASLADGIKGITEDTANLLASYLNAIRADVSYARTIWERMDATTQQIAAMLVNFSVPNLMEYQAQIAANTYNTAMHTQSIMEDLRSMMTSDGGATALRVYS